MKRSGICAVIVDYDLEAIKSVTPLVDLFEVRIDLIGDGWREVVKELKRPWIACNRRADEGGCWQGSEDERVAELLCAVELGADIIDVELQTRNLEQTVTLIKRRAKCLLSSHNLVETPSLDQMKEVMQKQLAAGADISKVVTTALKFEDNLALLQLISEFPQARVVSFAMGPLGLVSRILSPLVGGDFTYASMANGRESASGQPAAGDLRALYGVISNGKNLITAEELGALIPLGT